MSKLVDEAPYHPGYEDAVVPPKPAYKGLDPAKMIWKAKPLSDEEIEQIYYNICLEDKDNQVLALARAIEERHGIK